MLLYSAEGRPRAPIGRIGTDPRWCSYGGGLGVLRQARVGAASGKQVLPECDQPPDVEAAVFSYRQSSLSRDCHGAPSPPWQANEEAGWRACAFFTKVIRPTEPQAGTSPGPSV